MATTHAHMAQSQRHPHAHKAWLAFTGTFGRIIFAVPFIVFGVFHFIEPAGVAAAVPDWVPLGGMFWAIVTGVVLTGGGVALVIGGTAAAIAGPVLTALLVVFVVTIHVPAVIAGAEGAEMARISLLKDIALAGAALLAAHQATAERDRRR